MLYDPKWEAPVKVEPYSIEGLIAWLEKQPADTEYDWPDTHGCLACKYLEGIGRRELREGTLGSVFKNNWTYHQVCAVEPWTFGAALKRARECAAES